MLYHNNNENLSYLKTADRKLMHVQYTRKDKVTIIINVLGFLPKWRLSW